MQDEKPVALATGFFVVIFKNSIDLRGLGSEGCKYSSIGVVNLY